MYLGTIKDLYVKIDRFDEGLDFTTLPKTCSGKKLFLLA